MPAEIALFPNKIETKIIVACPNRFFYVYYCRLLILIYESIYKVFFNRVGEKKNNSNNRLYKFVQRIKLEI
ncbi:hypothetical protein GCM10009120_50160 [Sphingobacterium siyangense subsp. cladoniae]